MSYDIYLYVTTDRDPDPDYDTREAIGYVVDWLRANGDTATADKIANYDHLRPVVDCVYNSSPTYNIGPMFRDAFQDDRGIRIVSGMSARDSIPLLTAACARFNARWAEMEAMNPSNGWGSAGGALSELSNMLHAATCHPDGVWSA